MRVLLLAENWPPRRGGIENYLTSIARYLSEGDIQVEVIAPRGKGVRSSDSEKTAGGEIVQRRRFFWPLIRPQWLPLFAALWRQAKRDKWDVTLCGKGLFEGLVGYYLKKHLGIPYIVFTYSMEIEEWTKSARERRKLQRVLTGADRVVYINDETKKHLSNLGVRGKQLVKIWPGVDDRFFVPAGPVAVGSPPDLRPDSPRPGNPPPHHPRLRKPYVLCVARLVPRKGVDLLIEAFAQLDQVKFGNVQLVIAGEGPERSELEELAKKEWVHTSVKFLGFVPDEDLPELYAGAEIFALTPRAHEGFGIVYAEAAAAGIPAIATNIGGAKEAVVDGETGLVVKPEVTEIKQALEKLLSDADLRKKLGKAAKQRAEDQFKWSKRILLVKGMLDTVVH